MMSADAPTPRSRCSPWATTRHSPTLPVAASDPPLPAPAFRASHQPADRSPAERFGDDLLHAARPRAGPQRTPEAARLLDSKRSSVPPPVELLRERRQCRMGCARPTQPSPPDGQAAARRSKPGGRRERLVRRGPTRHPLVEQWRGQRRTRGRSRRCSHWRHPPRLIATGRATDQPSSPSRRRPRRALHRRAPRLRAPTHLPAPRLETVAADAERPRTPLLPQAQENFQAGRNGVLKVMSKMAFHVDSYRGAQISRCRTGSRSG